MREDTPRLKNRRKNLAEEFGKNWDFDFSTKQIVRKPRSLKRRCWEFLVQKKFSIFAFYWWTKYERYQNETFRKFSSPVRHDNTPVKGVPMKYERQGGWTFKAE